MISSTKAFAKFSKGLCIILIYVCKYGDWLIACRNKRSSKIPSSLSIECDLYMHKSCLDSRKSEIQCNKTILMSKCETQLTKSRLWSSYSHPSSRWCFFISEILCTRKWSWNSPATIFVFILTSSSRSCRSTSNKMGNHFKFALVLPLMWYCPSCNMGCELNDESRSLSQLFPHKCGGMVYWIRCDSMSLQEFDRGHVCLYF